MLSEYEIKMYSEKYAKMRQNSVFIFGGDYFSYDKRNDIYLNKFRHIIESKSGLSITTKNLVELQCLRFLAMRELAYRTQKDGVDFIKLKVDDPRRNVINKFEEMADNPYIHHPWGIAEKYQSDQMLKRTAYNIQQANGDEDEAAPTIN